MIAALTADLRQTKRAKRYLSENTSLLILN